MWTSLGNPGTAAADLSLGINGDGHLELFALTIAQEIWHIWQTSPGGAWTDWTIFSAASDTAIAITVAENADTRLELFRVDQNGAVLHSWQTAPNAGWSDWGPLDNPNPASALNVARNADGRLELFIFAGDVWHAYQTTPNGGWSEKPCCAPTAPPAKSSPHNTRRRSDYLRVEGRRCGLCAGKPQSRPEDHFFSSADPLGKSAQAVALVLTLHL